MEKEMLEKIGKLEKELENANDLLSATKRKGMTDRSRSWLENPELPDWCFLATIQEITLRNSISI